MPSPSVNVNIDLNRLIEQVVNFAKELKTHLGSLISMPALARQRLDEVLAEIDNTFTVVDGVVREHLRVALDPSLIESDPDLLIRLAGPELPERIKRDRGHCYNIRVIYDNYLQGLLDPLFSDTEARNAVNEMFRYVTHADMDLFGLFDNVGTALQERAKQALLLQLNSDTPAAKALLKNDAANLIDMRQRLQDAHLTLVGIRNDFIKGMIPPP